VPFMSRSRLFYGHIDGSVMLSFSCSGFTLLNYLCAGSFSFPFGDVEGDYQWEVQTPNGWTPYWEAPKALATTEGGTLGHGFAFVSLRVFAFAYRLTSASWTLLY
jgi:hypothetical protein